MGDIPKLVPVTILIREEAARLSCSPTAATGDPRASHSPPTLRAATAPPTGGKKTTRDKQVDDDEDTDESLDDAPEPPKVRRKLNPPSIAQFIMNSELRIGPPNRHRVKFNNSNRTKYTQPRLTFKIGPPKKQKPLLSVQLHLRPHLHQLHHQCKTEISQSATFHKVKVWNRKKKKWIIQHPIVGIRHLFGIMVERVTFPWSRLGQGPRKDDQSTVISQIFSQLFLLSGDPFCCLYSHKRVSRIFSVITAPPFTEFSQTKH